MSAIVDGGIDGVGGPSAVPCVSQVPSSGPSHTLSHKHTHTHPYPHVHNSLGARLSAHTHAPLRS
ncbi:hypothetical protein LZ32DRAFT_600342 [Colletotrichum eremochloae]|nr:hypothetical protein LZ32DRAFT_600342 [Colletotrichum eremochloae]